MELLDTQARIGTRGSRAADRSATVPGHDHRDLTLRVQAVAAVAAEAAAAVDSDARFPGEAIDAARAQRLLGAMIPPELGGDGASVSDIVDICYVLGRSCASAAMVFAMHQIMVACIARHGRSSTWQRGLMRRIAAEQLLLASSTTDGQGGGDLRSSVAAVERNGFGIALTKSATVMSYGEHADGVVTTARRSGDAAASDQVLVAFLKDDYDLERLVEWDALGMRGTCSAGFTLKATGESGQILPDAYQKIHAHTMMPIAHLTWSAVWAGITAGAVERARAFVRGAAHKGGGRLPPGAAHLTRAGASLRALRGIVASALARYENVAGDETELESLDFQTAMNLLKVNASELAISAVMSALRACGLSGYRNDGEFSVSRHLRDILSSPIMINNDRILANSETASLLLDVPASLTD